MSLNILSSPESFPLIGSLLKLKKLLPSLASENQKPPLKGSRYSRYRDILLKVRIGVSKDKIFYIPFPEYDSQSMYEICTKSDSDICLGILACKADKSFVARVKINKSINISRNLIFFS